MSPDAREAQALSVLVSELQATLGRFALALALARDAFAWTDERGNVIWCNPAFDRLARADHITLLGEPMADRLALEHDGQAVTGEAHPARRIMITPDEELSETYEIVRDGERVVVDLHGRRGRLAGGPAAVFVIRDVTARAEAQAEMNLLNTRLEAANTELEAFSYSVSHDLRTPLRAIDGFSQALLEDYAEVLDTEGQDYLRRLRAAAQSMGRLIEDMLRLSRVTRAELAWTDVDLTAMCRSILAELAAESPERDVEVAVADGLTARGDEQLLHQAMSNLLENAWKFTRRTPHPRIEVGALSNHERMFFVRDNGAGFDMARADKLFAAFQRLHTTAEFPGTGIGLAIVRRIVHRHGGRVWAEGEVGKGATFYFTLPSETASAS